MIPITINEKVLAKLPIFKSPPTYRLQRDLGNGCAGDPPGYPSYFTQSVYTQSGNSPSRGEQMVIFGRVLEDSRDHEQNKSWDETYEKRKKLLRRLWKPLPFDHPRTQAWVSATFSHHNHCYQDDSKSGSWSDKTIIFPVPSYTLRSFVDDARFSDEWRTKEKASIAQANKEITDHAAKVATPENHSATLIIRRYYPDFQPTEELINNPTSEANWWERLHTCPKPEDCPGQYGTPHPVNGKWCQMCGWHEKEEVKCSN
jgi:hypothetical protein